MSRAGEFCWLPSCDERLTKLWAEGLTTAEIGRRFGVSKNSIIGRAHRLNLPKRPSPLRPRASGKPARVKRAPKITLQIEPVVHAAPRPVPRAPVARPVSIIKPDEPVKPAYAGPILECSFITSVGRPWRYCNAPTLPGRSYCAHHHTISHVRGSALRAA